MGFSWSFSKLDNYETCPFQYYNKSVIRSVKERMNPNGPLAKGKKVHEALALALSEGKPLDVEYIRYQHWVDKLRWVEEGEELLVEQKYALDKDFNPCDWTSDNCWYRGIADVVKINGPVALAVDWKTGKIKVDSVQLMLMAQCIFSYFPQVRKVRTEFIWLQDNVNTPEIYDRETMVDEWVSVLERVKELERAHEENSFPPKRGYLCKKWCPVSGCIYHGK